MIDILDIAKDTITGSRLQEYGDAEENFGRIAAMWTAYLGVPVSAKDVAMLMILHKVSRARHKVSTDTLVDIAGYAALTEGFKQ